MKMPSEATRAWLYEIGVSVLSVLAVKNLIDAELLAVLKDLLAAVLLGLARKNVSKSGGGVVEREFHSEPAEGS